MYINNKSIFTNTNNAPKEIFEQSLDPEIDDFDYVAHIKRLVNLISKNTTTTRSFAIKFRQSQ